MASASSIWVVSEDQSWADSLSFHLRALAEVRSGPPERGRWRDVSAPDLLVLLAVDAPSDDLSGLEKLLEFVRSVPVRRRAPHPLLFVEPPSRQPSGELALRLIDDRKVLVAGWPLEPDEIAARAAELLQGPESPAGLRERARRDWVRERVELLYAGLDLPALRQAVNPRNAERPVLLLGEPGTYRGLLARYIHNLAEPAREELIVLPMGDLDAQELERRVLERSAGRRVTLYLSGLGDADRGRQQELAHLLGSSGMLAVEPIRWIASAYRASALAPELRLLPWIRAELPSLRSRPDVESLLLGLIEDWSRRAGRTLELAPEALAALTHYAWPANLRELETSIEASCNAASGGELRAEDLAIGALALTPAPATAHAHASVPDADTAVDPGTVPEAPPEPEPELEPLEAPQTPYEPEPSELSSLEDLTEASFAELPAADEAIFGDELPEPLPEFPSEPNAPPPSPAQPDEMHPELNELVPAITQEIRQPLRAIRTYASLLDQRPEDPARRRELASLFETDLGRVEATLSQLERYASFGPARPEPFDLASTVAAELEKRRDATRANSLVVLRELDHDAPPVHADEEQVRFAIGALIDRALRMVPARGDLYVGTKHHRGEADRPARHRLLIRFHSPEDVLIGPEDGPGPRVPIEVMLARELIERSAGSFAVDASGAQDNVILVELPG